MILSKINRAISLCACIGIVSVSFVSFSNHDITLSSTAKSTEAKSITYKPSQLHTAFTAANRNYGYINDDGRFVIGQRFLEADEFNSKGCAVVSNDNYKQGVIDLTGRYVVQPKYDFAGGFENGKAVFIVNNDKEGIIDSSGRIIINPVYSRVDNFSEGIAVAQNYDNKRENLTSYALDTSGKLIFKYKGEIGDFHDGMSLLRDNESNLYGYIDKTGKVVIKPSYYYANDFKDNKAEVEITANKYYDIDKTGKVLDKKSSDDLDYEYQRFSDGYYIKRLNNATLFNKNGKSVIKNAGCINRINADYYAVSNLPFDQIFSMFEIPTAFYNKSGKRLTPYIYYNATELQNGFIAVMSDNQTYLLDGNLKEISAFKKLQGDWRLTMSGSLIKAVFNNDIRYYTKQGKLVFQSDGDFTLGNKAILSCVLYSPNMHVRIEYPQIASLPDKKVCASINTKLKNHFINGEVKNIVKNNSASYQKNFTFNIISDILHIQASGNEGSTGMTSVAPKQLQSDYYFDMKSGKEYTLDDLFKKSSGYKAYIENSLFHIDGDYQHSDNGSTKITYQQITGFTLLKDKIRLYYLVYSFAGQPPYHCDITYSQLNNYIDKSSAFWKNISLWKS